MASLQKIRNHGPLLILIVGLAMLAFILGDVLTNVGHLRGGNEQNVGSINGEVVSRIEFDNARHQLEELKKLEGATIQLNDSTTLSYFDYLSRNGIYVPSEITNEYVWESFKMYYIYKTQADKLGLSLTSDEIASFEYQFPGVPRHIAEGVSLQRKYIMFLQSAFHANSVEAEFAFNSRQHGVSAEYVAFPYDAVADSLVEVSDEDILAVYEKYKPQLKQEPNRKIEYVVMDYAWTEDDMIKESLYMDNLKEEFMEEEDIEDFLGYYDSDPGFDKVITYTEETVPAAFKEFAFGENAELDACTDPIFMDDAMAMARIMNIDNAAKTVDLAILKRTIIPSDNTKAAMEQQYRQLIQENETIDEFEEALKQEGLFPLIADVKMTSDKLNGIKNGARQIVQSAFHTAEGEVCNEVFECGDQIVIAAVVEVNEDKYMPLDKVTTWFRVEAMNKAKAQYIMDNFAASTIEEAAAKWNQEPQSVARIAFDENNLEPVLVGAALAQQENAVSEMLEGNMAVYIVKTGTSFDLNEEYTDEVKQTEKANLYNGLGAQFQQAIELLYSEAEVEIFDVNQL